VGSGRVLAICQRNVLAPAFDSSPQPPATIGPQQIMSFSRRSGILKASHVGGAKKMSWNRLDHHGIADRWWSCFIAYKPISI